MILCNNSEKMEEVNLMMRCLRNVLALHLDLMEHKYILLLTLLVVLDKTETHSDVTKKD